MSQPDPKKTAMTSLEQLKASGTVVVADTGDFEAIAKFKPRFFNVQFNCVSFIDQDVTCQAQWERILNLCTCIETDKASNKDFPVYDTLL